MHSLPSPLDALVDRIHDKYIDNISATHKRPPQANAKEEEIPLRQLRLKEKDWLLWRVKCTVRLFPPTNQPVSTHDSVQPRKEYYLMYELITRHQTLSEELRSVFSNPRDIGYIYLEAHFTKSGISSLREILREYSDLKLSSLAVVPEADLKHCLTIEGDARQVFAAGHWVQIKRGLYRGDVGVVVDDFRDEDSTTGIKVAVVPRLDFSPGDEPSAFTSKRKFSHRPAPRLFNHTQCAQKSLVQHKQHVFSYKAWRFEYGLLLKIYSESSITPAREMPLALCKLFLSAKDHGANGIDMSSMPIHSFWRFEVGERVIVEPEKKYGTVASPFDPVNTVVKSSYCEVDFEDEGRHLVPIQDMAKEIILGQHVEVLAGVHTGKKGFVIAQDKAFLGICVGTSGLVSSKNLILVILTIIGR